MSETSSELAQQPPLSTVGVETWVKMVDDNFLDQSFTFDRGNGQETVILRDATRDRKAMAESTHGYAASAVLEHKDGSKEKVSAADFLSWQGLTDEAIQSMVSATEQDHDRPVLAPHIGYASLVGAMETPSKAENNSSAKRAILLFAPISAKATPLGESSVNYDALLEGKSEELSVYQAAIRVEPGRDVVTTESEKAAFSRLVQAAGIDEHIHRIVFENQRIKGTTPALEDIIGLVRTDASLRQELGTYLISKIEQPNVIGKMPHRVLLNTEKQPSYPGYRKIPSLTSREYTALLAMSMLDGTFNQAASSSEEETYDRASDGGVGQHRYAARQLLETPDYDTIEQ